MAGQGTGRRHVREVLSEAYSWARGKWQGSSHYGITTGTWLDEATGVLLSLRDTNIDERGD